MDKVQFCGMRVKVDPNLPPGEVRFVDPATGKCVGKIVNASLPEPPK